MIPERFAQRREEVQLLFFAQRLNMVATFEGLQEISVRCRPLQIVAVRDSGGRLVSGDGVYTMDSGGAVPELDGRTTTLTDLNARLEPWIDRLPAALAGLPGMRFESSDDLGIELETNAVMNMAHRVEEDLFAHLMRELLAHHPDVAWLEIDLTRGYDDAGAWVLEAVRSEQSGGTVHAQRALRNAIAAVDFSRAFVDERCIYVDRVGIQVLRCR